MGSITTAQVLLMSGAVGGLGLAILWHAVNPLTMWLTLGTFVGYAVVYTVILKPATPQNIVIGGASGAMPPVLGWAAITGDVPYQPLLLFLIIFAWTPPHFWALALYRRREYERAGMPMLPVTHGEAYTRLHLLLYTLILVAATLLPFATGMAGVFYLGAALVLDAVFVGYAVAICVSYSDALAKRTFRYSIFYLAMLFAALMVDHYLPLLRRRDEAPRVPGRGPRLGRRRGLRPVPSGLGDPLQRHRRHRLGPGPRSPPDRPQRQAALARRFPRQGRDALLRLHAVPGRLPDHPLRTWPQAVKNLGADASRVQVLFVTVDPEARHARAPAQYVPAFNPAFLGLYGDAAATRKVTRDFKIYAEERPGQDARLLHGRPFRADVRLRHAG